VKIIPRSAVAFAILQGLVLLAPQILSAPTKGITADACLACADATVCDPRACHKVAIELAEARDYGRAIAIEEKVRVFDPANPEVAAALAKMLESGPKDVVSAIRLYHEALYVAPGYPPALLGLGNLMKDRGELAVAEKYFERGMRENPAQPLFKVRLAEVLIETGRAERAQPLLEEIVAQWPESGEADRAKTLMTRTALARP
jgi:tetratricopeptide (TPR) repeat protein